MAKEKRSRKAHKELPKYKGENDTFATARLTGGFELPRLTVRAVRNNLTAYLWLVGLPIVLDLYPSDSRRIFNFHVTPPQLPFWVISIGLLSFLVAVLVAPGAIVLQLNSVREHKIDAAAAFRQGLHFFWRFLGFSIFAGVILIFSLLLFIVPFFIVLPRLVLAPYYLIDQDMSISEALGASWNQYKKYGQLWGVIGVWALIFIVFGAIPLIGGLVSGVAEFFYSPAFAIRYEQYKLLEAGKTPRTPVEIKAAKSAS